MSHSADIRNNYCVAALAGQLSAAAFAFSLAMVESTLGPATQIAIRGMLAVLIALCFLGGVLFGIAGARRATDRTGRVVSKVSLCLAPLVLALIVFTISREFGS